MAYLTETRNHTHSLADRFGDLVARAKTALERRRVYRTTLSELENLNARELADLGLSRSTIRSVAYQAAYEN